MLVFLSAITGTGIVAGDSTLIHRSCPSCPLSGLLTAPKPGWSRSSRTSTAARLELLPAPARARIIVTDASDFRTAGRGAGETSRLRIGHVRGHPCGPAGTNDEGGKLGFLPRASASR